MLDTEAKTRYSESRRIRRPSMRGLPEVPECPAQAIYTRLPSEYKTDMAGWCPDTSRASHLPEQGISRFKTQHGPIRERIRKKVMAKAFCASDDFKAAETTLTSSKRLKCKMVRVTTAY
jgi:hypothetical protein